MLNNVKVNKKEKNECSNIMNFLEISEKNYKELNYLIILAKKLGDNVLLAAKENIFQFNCTYNEQGRNETFGSLYKSSLTQEIIWELIHTIAEEKYKNKKEDKKLYIDDFSLYYYDMFLEKRSIGKNIIKFITKIDLSKIEDKKNIIEIFKNQINLK